MRISIEDLKRAVNRLNKLTNSPMETYLKIDGKNIAQIRNYHLDGAYGGWKLSRIMNEAGGCEDVLRCGFCSKPELYKLIHVFIDGIERGEK